MVLVMIAGMLVLGSALALLAAALGAGLPELGREAPAVLLLGMGFSMTAPMVWWMRRRGHSRANTREMAGAMIVPSLAVVALLAFGIEDVAALLGIQHVAMFPSMLAVMILRRQEYSHPHAGTHRREAVLGSTAETNEPQAAARERFPSVPRKLATIFARRWPSWLALGLVTVTVADGEPLPIDIFAWLTLVLPLAYLAFGAARKQLRPPAMLALQLAVGFFYIGLAAVALSVDDDLARYLVAFGWIAHAFWDGAFFHANRVVPRQWAEWCFVVDMLFGGAILLLR